MSQEQLLVLLFKIVLVADLVTLAVFIADYTRLTRGEAWRNPIGRTILWKDVLLGAALTPSVLSLFFHFSRLTSRIAGWVDIALFAAISVAVVWRIAVFEKIHRSKETAAAEPEDCAESPEDEAAP